MVKDASVWNRRDWTKVVSNTCSDICFTQTTNDLKSTFFSSDKLTLFELLRVRLDWTRSNAKQPKFDVIDSSRKVETGSQPWSQPFASCRWRQILVASRCFASSLDAPLVGHLFHPNHKSTFLFFFPQTKSLCLHCIRVSFTKISVETNSLHSLGVSNIYPKNHFLKAKSIKIFETIKSRNLKFGYMRSLNMKLCACIFGVATSRGL